MKTFYNIISLVFQPLLMPTYAILLLMNMDIFSPMPLFWRWIAIIGTLIFTGILPALPIWLMMKRGEVHDLFISKKEERTMPYLFSFLAYVFWSMFMWRTMQFPMFIVAMGMGSAASVFIILFINLKWKISAHAAGMGGLTGSIFGVCYRTAWRIKHKLMQVMHEREALTILGGRVEVDDSYLGGQRSGGKVGRGSENMMPFVAAVETNKDGHPIRAVFSPVKSFSSHEIAAWARKSLAPSAVVVSDGYYCFRAVTKAGCSHEAHVVGKKRKSTDMGCFAWVNTVLSNIKTAVAGTYHGFEFSKYAGRYLSEVQYRFNRRFDLSSIFPRLLYAGANTGKRTEVWLRLAEA